MHKQQKLIFRLFKMTFTTSMIILFGLMVKGYSSQLGLFDNINVEINGNQFVHTKRFQEEVTPFLTQSLLSLNLKEIQDGVSSIDFVETAQVSRILPNILMIQILEREPIVMIAIEDNNLFMDKKGALLPADGYSISFFPVPIITISEGMEYTDELPGKVSELFQFILNEYPMFYDNLSEVIIENEKWIFFCDSKTRIITTSDRLFIQLNVLKYFEKTISPNRELDDYAYIDLRVAEQVVVKEKYRKG